jgi:phosphoribosylaminoimidazole-succinocarboxamide synthase
VLKERIYEGKAKILYKSDKNDLIYQYFKDDATAFNALKKDIISGKGILNNFISEFIMNELNKQKINTHFVKRIDDRVQLVQKLNILPLEVIVRNYAAGSICKRLDIKENTNFKLPLIEFCYKRDDLGDPLITEDHILLLEIATESEIKLIKAITNNINDVLLKLFDSINIKLVDFKIEFGRNDMKQIILADEISPDSCRLWDNNTGEKMDKDRFRLDLGSLTKYYAEIANRFNINLPNFDYA